MMQNKTIEMFYLFFQGIVIFQVVVFGVLHLFTHRKDLLYYTIFLLFASTYFFINAPFTFFGIPEEIVWNSDWYGYINTPIIIVENYFYLLFLKSFFADLTIDKTVNRLFRFILQLIPVLLFVFLILTLLQINKQSIFYMVNLISVVPAVSVAYIILKKKLPFAALVATGLICTIIGTCTTVVMIVLGNSGINSLFTVGYPLIFVRLGILGDMIFYLTAILKKWNYQEKQLAVEKIQSQLAIEKLRNKISGELHDDIGSTLSGISMYSYMMNDFLQTGKFEEAKSFAVIIQRSTTEITHSLSDLVWTINPERDTLKKLILRLEEFARNIADTKHMKVSVAVDEYLSEHDLSMDKRRNIYLFCKEAINNAVKYSNGTLLELNIKENSNILQFFVKDNGIGFDINNTRSGNGLENMQKRAKEADAIFNIQTCSEQGTTVSMEFKIT